MPTVPNDPNRATALLATSRQLAIGNDQWIDLRCKVSDLIRVGTDPTRTLAHVNAVEILITLEGTTDPVTVSYGAAWLAGGRGPDVGDTGLPYVYCYRYRSSTTGAVSNPSSASRGGVVPRRQRVTLTGVQSTDPQVDLVDWFGFGGALTAWTYLGTSPNDPTPSFDVDVADTNVEGGERLRFDRFQPWPTSDLPRQGQCRVAGTAVQWISGDAFNPAWAPGTSITVNGVTTEIYAIASATLLHVVANCGAADHAAFSIPEPTLLGQPLPALWGGMIANIVYLFACGDPTDPGAVHWTHANDPDTTSDANWLAVTSASEPLQHGCVYNGQSFVGSTADLYLLVPTPGQPSPFRAQRTPCGRGFWSRWALCVGPAGIYFLSDDGIYLTNGGAPAVSITDPDLRELFPHDGIAGRTVNGIVPPDLSATTRLRLSYVDHFVYFDYAATDGASRTLVYDTLGQRWFYDEYASGVWARLEEVGAGVHQHLIGALNGHAYRVETTAITDDGTPIAWDVWTPWPDGDRPRLVKEIGDLMIDVDPAASAQGITVTPVIDDATQILPAQTVGAGDSGRQQFALDLDNGEGVDARNVGLRIASSLGHGDTARPRLYLWQASWTPKAEDIARRPTPWDDLGYAGAKFVQGIVIRANTYGAAKQVIVDADGAQQLTLTITHDGDREIAYPREAAGWTPFVAHLVRLRGGDDVTWQVQGARWVFEPAPELATEWHTQATTHDCAGFFTVRDLTIAYEATAAVALEVTYTDGPTHTYTLAATARAYARVYVPARAGKGTAVRYRWTSDEPFRLFQRDCTVRVQAWGAPDGYRVAQPFGGPSRVTGAAI